MRAYLMAALVITSACTYEVGTPPARQNLNPPPATGSTAAASPPGLPGIEKFDRSVMPVTQICGVHTYNVRYSTVAQTRLAAAIAARPGAKLTALVDKVDVRVRCHSEGFGGMATRCHADTALAMTVSDQATGAGRRVLETGGKSSEAVVFNCGNGAQAIEQSMDDALARMADRLLAPN